MSSIPDILREELERLRSDIIFRHEQAGQKATGETERLFSTEVQNTLGRLFGPLYSGVLERGRKPGGVPRDFIEILKRWAAAKGISFSDEKQFNLWANAVKWKIIREGTKLYRSGQTEDIFSTPYEEFDTRFSTRIAAYFESEINNLIFER